MSRLWKNLLSGKISIFGLTRKFLYEFSIDKIFLCRIGDFDKYFGILFQIFASSFLRNLKRSEKLSTFFFVRKRQKGKVSWIYFFFSCNFIKFANLTLISPNGLPYDNDYNDLSDRMIPFTGRYCRKYRRELPTRVWINIVYGTVITINR